MYKLALVVLIAMALRGETISGTILIQRKLTKPNVTPSVSIYQRGTTVALGKDSEAELQPEDFLESERKRVVIWIEGAEGEGQAPAADVSLEQSGRRFIPELVVVPVGSTVSFPNLDPVFHNVFSLSKTKSFDLGNYPKGQSRSVKFTKPGIVYVNCHLHPNMAATIVVTPNARFTRADRSGSFEFPELSPGKYSVVAWHKAAGFFRQAVEVRPGSGATISFLIPLSGGDQ